MRQGLKAILGVCAALALTGGLAAPAEAVPITGGITFGGTIEAMDFTAGSFIDVIADQATVTCAVTNTCNGSYSSLIGGLVAAYNDFTFDPLPAGGYIPLWSLSNGGLTYSFDLLTLTVVSRTPGGIVLNGTGTAHITGFDNTPARWSFSADETGLYAFSSTAAPTPVPEPGTMMLLGVGMAAGVIRRRVARASR